MWTRAPSVTSCCVDYCLALDHEEQVGSGASTVTPRLHHRGVSSSNHQPGEQELLLLQDTPPTTKPESALDFHTLDVPTTTIHHDLPKPPGSSKRLLPSTTTGASFASETCQQLSPMSTPELASVLVARVRHLQPPPVAKTTSCCVNLVPSCVRKETLPQLVGDMQTVQITNAHTTPASSSSNSSDQEVPEVVLPSPSKRRRLVYNNEPELNDDRPPSEALLLSLEAGCEDSGLTGEQHMADLDRPSKSSTPEADIDSATVVPQSQLATSPVPQCDANSPGSQQVVEQDSTLVVTDQVLQPEPSLLIVSEHLQQFSASSSQQTNIVVPATNSPGDDDTQYYSTSQFLPPAGHVWVPDSRISDHTVTQTMAGGDEWLQLSLGSHGQSDEPEPPAATTVPLELYQQSPIQHPPTTTPDPPGIRDFFGTSESEASSSHRHSGESSKLQQHYYSDPRAPRPLFREPRPRAASRDSTWLDPNVHTPRVQLPDPAFVSPSLTGSFSPQQFSNLSSLPYHPARVLQPVRSDHPTDTTSVHAWRSSSAHEAGPSSGPHYASATAPWIQQQPQQLQDPQRTSPNPAAEFLSMATPGAAWRPSSSFQSMQPPVAQGVDPEQAWRNLLQRVGNNMNVPRPGAPESSMLPPGEREEYLDALKRAVERFQGTDQGGKLVEPALTELQRWHRSAAMFPPGQQLRPPHHPGLPFDPSSTTELARFYSASLSSSSGSRARAPPAAAGTASSSERQRRILRPHAPRPGLWFTLQASNSPPGRPEASPLQQIPTAYIRVVDDTMTVAAVRRYLANKLGLASEDEVELTCKGQALQPSISLHQVRDAIWQSPNTNTHNPNTSQLLSEGKAWKAPDGSITLVGDVVMVLTYDRRRRRSPALELAPDRPTSST